MQHLLFLDFDGVLHPTTVPYDDLFCRMPLLTRAVDGLDCKIVISSSWRHYYTSKRLLGHFPESLRSKIVGFTGDVVVGEWPRYQEILNFLKTHPHSNWRALDDSHTEFPESCPQLLLCNPKVAMEEEHVLAIRQWLQEG